MLEAEVIRHKIKQLDRYLAQLSRYQGITAADLQDDLDKAWVVERGLQLSIQVVLDIGNHILAEAGITAGEYKDIFEELARLGVIPAHFADRLKGMPGFRNILVHEYGRVDYEIVAGIINNNLAVFQEFADYIMQYMER